MRSAASAVTKSSVRRSGCQFAQGKRVLCPLKVGAEMKEPLAVLSPPGVAVAVAIIGLIVIAFDLFHERAGGVTSSTTALAALAAGATVSPTERTWVAPSGRTR
jgi:hypothetical protein